MCLYYLNKGSLQAQSVWDLLDISACKKFFLSQNCHKVLANENVNSLNNFFSSGATYIWFH